MACWTLSPQVLDMLSHLSLNIQLPPWAISNHQVPLCRARAGQLKGAGQVLSPCLNEQSRSRNGVPFWRMHFRIV